MRYRFFAEEKTGPGFLGSLGLVILSIQAAISLSRLSLGYYEASLYHNQLLQRLTQKQEELEHLRDVEMLLSTEEGIAALGYNMGLVFPEDLVFFDGS